jgi:hypothetical protein
MKETLEIKAGKETFSFDAEAEEEEGGRKRKYRNFEEEVNRK